MKVDRFLESTGLHPSGIVTFDQLKTILEGEDPPANSPENQGPNAGAGPALHVATPSPATPAPGSTPPGGVPQPPNA